MAPLRRMLLLSVMCAAVVACGDPDNNDRTPANIKVDPNSSTTNNSTNNDTNNGTNNPTNNDTNSGTNNATNNGFGEACADVECPDPDRRCVKGVCVLRDLKVACEDFEDLGEADLTASIMASGDTDGFADAIETTCSEMDEFSGAENAFRFTVPTTARVSVDLTSSAAIDWVVEVRKDDCGSADARVTCSDPESFNFIAEPGTDYYVLVEPRVGIDKGTFDLALTFEELVCSPPGGRSCDADTVVVCQAGTSEARYGCGTDCNEGVCAGDRCDNTFEVTAGMSFSGDTQAFTDTLNFESQPSCSQSGQQGLITPGPEMILSLPGLTAGQTVVVDASVNDDNDNAIFVLDSCTDAMACVAAVDLGDVLTWDVEADGDYFVVIDKLSTSAKPFNYTIDIQ